jgi:hypothetical protein|tara:strand:- start:127 stop:711 length:585 start_codon:yes stop_codon:yes gene_type:complete
MADATTYPIRARTILEVLGKPKAHVEKTIRMLVEEIKENSDISILNEKFEPPKKLEKSLFSTYVEIEMVAKGMDTLVGFCFDYMPSSIDIEKPAELLLKNSDISAVFNDLQAKLHQVDMVAKQLRAESTFLKNNLNNMLRNNIAVLISVGRNTYEKLEKLSGIDPERLKEFLDQEVKEGKLTLKDDEYEVAKSE